MNDVSKSIRKEILSMPSYPAPALADIQYKLNQNESPFDVPLEIKQRIFERLQQTPFNRYNDGDSSKIRELLSEKFEVPKNRILVGAGIDELLYYLVLTVVNKGEKVVRFSPSFAMYSICTTVCGGTDVDIALDPNFSLTEEFYKESKDAALTFICSPNNPTGNSFSIAELEQIVKNSKGIVCIDEAYADFADENALSLLRYPNVVIMRTFSKAFSAAGVRFGVAIADPTLIENMNKIRLPWNIGFFQQIAAEELLLESPIFAKNVQYIKKERERVFAALQVMKNVIKVYPSQSNFILFRVPYSKKTYEALLKKSVQVRLFSSSLLQNCLRVSIGTKEENDAFLNALKKVFEVDLVIFDIDGVLVDVSNSYCEAIKRTVEKISNKKITDKDIEEIKKQPGSNNDWDVSFALAYDTSFSKIDRKSKKYQDLKAIFQDFYIGQKLYENEPLLISKGNLQVLTERGINIGVVTSRPRNEAMLVLKRLGIQYFDPKLVVAQEDCVEEKPSPKPIKLVVARAQGKNAIYIGDTINDQLAAERAGVSYQSVDATQSVNDILRRLLP